MWDLIRKRCQGDGWAKSVWDRPFTNDTKYEMQKKSFKYLLLFYSCPKSVWDRPKIDTQYNAT